MCESNLTPRVLIDQGRVHGYSLMEDAFCAMQRLKRMVRVGRQTAVCLVCQDDALERRAVIVNVRP